jgi:GTPase KRas protein
MSGKNDRLNPYKVVVFGSGGVGKSSVTLRFVTDTFSSEYLPTIEDCYRKNCFVDGKTAFLDILDTAGQEEYSALRDQWVREGKAFLLVYSVTSRQTFEEIPQFRERILIVNEDEVVPMVLVGNKIDLEGERKVSSEEGRQLAKEYGNIPFVECSALKGTNCDEVFYAAVREIRKMDQNHKKQDKDKDKEKGWGFCSIL